MQWKSEGNNERKQRFWAAASFQINPSHSATKSEVCQMLTVFQTKSIQLKVFFPGGGAHQKGDFVVIPWYPDDLWVRSIWQREACTFKSLSCDHRMKQMNCHKQDLFFIQRNKLQKMLFCLWTQWKKHHHGLNASNRGNSPKCIERWVNVKRC